MRTSCGTKMLRSQNSLDLVKSLAGDLAEDLIIACDWLGMSDDELNAFCYCLVQRGKTGPEFKIYFNEYQIRSGKGRAYLLADFVEAVMLEFNFRIHRRQE